MSTATSTTAQRPAQDALAAPAAADVRLARRPDLGDRDGALHGERAPPAGAARTMRKTVDAEILVLQPEGKGATS
jgi:hypothetical protein